MPWRDRLEALAILAVVLGLCLGAIHMSER
jgi:hypothetical protein